MARRDAASRQGPQRDGGERGARPAGDVLVGQQAAGQDSEEPRAISGDKTVRRFGGVFFSLDFAFPYEMGLYFYIKSTFDKKFN